MALRKTGYTEKTSKSYLVDAATLYTSVKFSSATKEFTGKLHGATSGGVTVTIEETYHDIEIDGANHMKVKGNKVLESANATVTANMKEITAESIRASVNGKSRSAKPEEAPEGYTVIETKRYLEDSDYIDNMAVVGKLSGTDEPVIIILDNVISTGGLELGTEDNAEAVIEQVYEAHATHEQLEADTYPWRILFPKVS